MFYRMVLSPTVLAHLEKAAKRAERVARADAGLGEAVEVPNHPSKRKQESLEKAKEASRRELSKIKMYCGLDVPRLKVGETRKTQVILWIT